MKAYYLDPDIYSASYNFKDEVDNAEGTDIEFVDNYTEDSGFATIKIKDTLDGH